MDKNTLLNVITMINVEIAVLENDMNKYHINKWAKDQEYYILLAQQDALGKLKWDLTDAIDTELDDDPEYENYPEDLYEEE
jgi:hypothetical protein